MSSPKLNWTLSHDSDPQCTSQCPKDWLKCEKWGFLEWLEAKALSFGLERAERNPKNISQVKVAAELAEWDLLVAKI